MNKEMLLEKTEDKNDIVKAEEKIIINIEKLFTIKVIRASFIMGIIMVMLEIVVYSVAAMNKLPYDYTLGLFKEDISAKEVVVGTDEVIKGPDVTMYIDEITIEDNIVTIKVSGTNQTNSCADAFKGGEYLLSAFNPNKSLIRKNYYSNDRIVCIAQAKSDYSFSLTYDVKGLDLSNGNIYTLSVYKAGADKTIEFILPIGDNAQNTCLK